MAAPPSSLRPLPVKLVAFDVDGTLTNSRHEVTEATRAAVSAVRAAGIQVVLATGRRYRDTLPVAAALGLTGPLVTASGALVKRTSDHATLFRAAFAPGVLAGVLDAIVSAGHEPVVYSDSYAEGFDFHCRCLPDGPRPPDGHPQGLADLAEYLERNRRLARVDPELRRRPPTDVFAGFAMGALDPMIALEHALHAAFPGRLSLHTIRSPRYLHWMCEIAPSGVTKWSGVAAVASDLGIAPEEICAVGDDVNDLPMIRAAGLGVAMGNARPEVLAAADHVVGEHDRDGIVQLAELLLSGEPPAPRKFSQTTTPR